MESTTSLKKRVYLFGGNHNEGNSGMKNLLGGKGANLAEMAGLGIPVPPGFTVTTDVCTEYHEYGKETVMKVLSEEVEAGIRHVEDIIEAKFGSLHNPCLFSVRSGARVSMPGMMDTVLNIGLKIGICGEHGGDPVSIDFFHRAGLDYVSCSPFRVPIARLAAAQAAIRELKGGGQ